MEIAISAKYGAQMANPSLNRTLCGGPRLAFISFLAKHSPRKVPVSSNYKGFPACQAAEGLN